MHGYPALRSKLPKLCLILMQEKLRRLRSQEESCLILLGLVSTSLINDPDGLEQTISSERDRLIDL